MTWTITVLNSSRPIGRISGQVESDWLMSIVCDFVTGREIRRKASWRLVVRSHLVRPAGRCSTIWRWQSQAIVGEGQTRCLPYSPFCSARMPISTPRNDRSQPREKDDGKLDWFLLLSNKSMECVFLEKRLEMMVVIILVPEHRIDDTNWRSNFRFRMTCNDRRHEWFLSIWIKYLNDDLD